MSSHNPESHPFGSDAGTSASLKDSPCTGAM
jgi:hypothetical protein